MKQFIVRMLANTFASSDGKKPSQSAVDAYHARLPQVKEQFYDIVRPMLARGEWIFDKSLWKWSEAWEGNELNLYATIAFTGDGSETEKEFMKYVRKTGLLEFDHTVIKKYS